MVNRRRALSALVRTIFGSMTGILGVVLGGAVLPRSEVAASESWHDGGAMTSMADGQPTEVAVRIERRDGYYTTTERRIVFVVRAGDSVRALSPICSHLGCRVAWHADAQLFKCPCHGGQFALDGRVVAGPPPRGLDDVPIRVEGTRVMVQLT